MPYINQNVREELDPYIENLIGVIFGLSFNGDVNDGSVNYVVTKILDACYNKSSYKTLQRAIGVLECCKLEFYRKVMALYEDIRERENGSVFFIFRRGVKM